MREMVMKNLISEDKRRRELFVSEQTKGKNLTQDLEKKSTYVIKDIFYSSRSLILVVENSKSAHERKENQDEKSKSSL